MSCSRDIGPETIQIREDVNVSAPFAVHKRGLGFAIEAVGAACPVEADTGVLRGGTFLEGNRVIRFALPVFQRPFAEGYVVRFTGGRFREGGGAGVNPPRVF